MAGNGRGNGKQRNLPATRKQVPAVIDAETGKEEKKARPDFDLESDPLPGKVPKRVITELVGAKQRAQHMAAALSDAIKAQAEKYKVKPAALREYIGAVATDKLEALDAKLDHLVKLIEDNDAA